MNFAMPQLLCNSACLTSWSSSSRQRHYAPWSQLAWLVCLLRISAAVRAPSRSGTHFLSCSTLASSCQFFSRYQFKSPSSSCSTRGFGVFTHSSSSRAKTDQDVFLPVGHVVTILWVFLLTEPLRVTWSQDNSPNVTLIHSVHSDPTDWLLSKKIIKKCLYL